MDQRTFSRSLSLGGSISSASFSVGVGRPGLVRADWAASYRGATAIVYGHTPVLHATPQSTRKADRALRGEWVNNTLCIDTGCVYGGKLTALRWPEKELVDVPAKRVWFEPTRPLGSPNGIPYFEAGKLQK